MTNFTMLYKYELKKILRRKIVWVSTAIILIIIAFTIAASLLGTCYADGVEIDTNYHMFHVDKEYQQSLDGRVIDQALLEEMKAGYDKIPSGTEKYTLMKEYQIYARPYSAIFNFVRSTTGMDVSETMQWTADEQDMYAKRQAMMERKWDSYLLSQREKDFWKEQEMKIEWPLKFGYKEGYWQLFDCLNTIGLMSLFAITISLSGVFPEEHIRKTDQLILSSRFGKKDIYWIKLLAGISFTLMISLLFTMVSFGISFALYGMEGFSSAFQLMWADYSYPISVGEAIFISYGMMVAACIITGVFVMVLSELLRNSIGTLALVMGMIILSMFLNIPVQYRVISQLWSYLPGEFIAVWSIFNPQTVSVFGRIFISWQVVPVIYLLISGAISFMGKKIYMDYQYE